jgi:hypothetical protein
LDDELFATGGVAVDGAVGSWEKRIGSIGGPSRTHVDGSVMVGGWNFDDGHSVAGGFEACGGLIRTIEFDRSFTSAPEIAAYAALGAFTSEDPVRAATAQRDARRDRFIKAGWLKRRETKDPAGEVELARDDHVSVTISVNCTKGDAETAGAPLCFVVGRLRGQETCQKKPQ